ncbi:hypothetical protein K3495_g12887 [Podosphaera aphanis]|nr:hypothetical protein K3495_g12887 [Podosphaera aphanis]
MPKLSASTRDHILELLKEGKLCREIWTELQCSKSVDSNIGNNFRGKSYISILTKI